MKIYTSWIILLFFLTTILCAQTPEVDNLLEKVNQASSAQEKKELIEKLKQEFADKNKKDREEADAIIKAKEKIPLRFFDDKAIKQ